MNIKNTYLGFTNALMPMQKARAEKLLDDVKLYDGVTMTNKEFVFNQVKAGSKPEVEHDVTYWSRRKNDYTKPKTEYRIVTADGTYWTVEKTLYNFALYLIENNMTDEENIQKCITEEQNKIEEEKRKQEELEDQRKQQEQKRIEFDNWLNESAKQYGDNEKLDLLRTIFIDETGQFGGGAIRLLVLIDNFDNPMCKDKLKDWLSYYNIASLKGFFHLTGINLGKTNKEIQARLDSITSKDFQGMVEYKPRVKNTKEETELETFYTYSFESINNRYEFQEAKGEHFTKYGLDFFIQKTNKGHYAIIEGTSGLGAGTGSTKQEAIKTLIDNINRIGIDKLQIMIEQAIQKNGISPKYKG